MNIVVSGASKGIGFELAEQAALSGHKVLAIARNKQLLETLRAKSNLISILSVDLINDSYKSAFAKWVEKSGKVDALINNAGQLINKPFLETTAAEFKAQFDANVVTAVKLIQTTVPFCTKNAHVVNISSMGGLQGSSKYPGLSAYSASKGALSVLTECLSVELKAQHISVNALALGAVQTEMLESAFPGYEAPVTPQEMATYILGFATTGHNYHNGQILSVALGNP